MKERFNATGLQLNMNMLRSVRRQILGFLSLFVVLGVFWCLKLTGITMAGEAFCGMEEHLHGDNCPTGRLICTEEETLGHTHDESCILQELICGQEEVPPHAHNEDCLYLELFCPETEWEGHTHDATCHALTLVCTEEERAGHIHNDGCFEQLLICSEEEGSPSHAHDETCYKLDLACDTEEGEEHTHDDACYELALTCPENEDTPIHTHGPDCYDSLLICGTEEDEGHFHGDICYHPEEDLICGQEEAEGHLHGEECYTLHEDIFICGLEETGGHLHTEDCFYPSIGFGCGMTEAEGHIHVEECVTNETELDCGEVYTIAHLHTKECYEELTECPLEEHIHEESCYSNLDADLETEEDWERSLLGVPEAFSTAETLVAVAHSQLGYAESTLNFEVDHHGVRRGITRYGQWYGNPYGDWAAMFASFCLHYAGAEGLPANAGPESMRLEWESDGLYEPTDCATPQIGNLIFLRSRTALPDTDFSAPGATKLLEVESTASLESQSEPTEVFLSGTTNKILAKANLSDMTEELPTPSTFTVMNDDASAVAIITDVSEDGITVIQGDVNGKVEEFSLSFDDPAILGYGLVPEMSRFALTAPAENMAYVGHTTNYSNNMFTDNRSFILYVEHEGQYYAIVSQPFSGMETAVTAVPIQIDSDGSIYTSAVDPQNLLWKFSRSGNSGSNYVIHNVATGRNLHPGGDYGIIYNNDANWPTALRASGTGAQLVHTENSNNVGIYFNGSQQRFEIVSNKSNASTLYFGMAEQCTVWLDGTNGELSSLGGSQNQSYSVITGSQMTLPMQWLSPTKYHYQLHGWYDVTHDQYYAPGEKVTITENTVFYADWIAGTYDIGQYNAYVSDTVSTNSFITTRVFDYNYLFNVLSADSTVTTSASSHSEKWSIVQNENVDYENRESLNFIFLDYGNGGTLDYPNNRQDGVNAFPGSGIVTGGIYTDAIGQALFSTEDHIPGKYYLGTADHLFQIMQDPSDEHYGYYYYDSRRNAASYNQSDERFYVYDYLEATSAELSASKSDFLPLNSPYANTNGQQTNTYQANGKDADMTNYVYDAKYDGSGNSVDRISTNYAFGMEMEIQFYLPNAPGEDGNKDLYGNDMCFEFTGDDDLWVLVDGELILDIGGIHQEESGEVNFSTGEVLIQGKRNAALSDVVAKLEPGEHTLTVMYLERGASHSNCSIYFNLAPRFQLSIQKEDVLTRDILNGAQFSVFRDLEGTIPAQLWESEESYLNGDPSTNVFTVENGSAHMWGMGAGNTYYIRETRAPDNADYGFPNGVIRMILDKKGAATYSVLVLDAGDGISGGFTVHGFRVDDETQQAYIIATNAPKWVKEVTTVEAQKFWDDGGDHTGESVTVYLTVHDQDGTVRRLQEAQLNSDNGWNHLWENLPKYHEDGTPITYEVEEAYVPGYYSKVEMVDSYAGTTESWKDTNTLENGKTYLLKTNSGFLSTLNRNSDTGFTWVDEDTAKQSDQAKWVVTKSGSTYKLTNKAGQTITFYNNGNSANFYASTGGETNNAKQYFSTTSGNSIRLYYYLNRRSYYITGSMTSANKLQYSTSSSSALLFTPMVMSQTSIDKDAVGEWAYQITNTPLQTETSLTVHKQWHMEDPQDPSLYEKAQVTVKLLANGKDSGRTVTLTLKNGWTDTFRGLPYEDEAGNVITYTVEEIWEKQFWATTYGEISVSDTAIPTYSTVITNSYHMGGPELPSTGSAARMLYILCGSGIMLSTLVYGFVSRRKWERRMK